MRYVANLVTGHRLLTATACMAFFALFTTACKKENDKGVTALLMNRWTLVQITDTTFTASGTPVYSKYEGKTNDYLDFRTDGKLYSYIDNNYDTARYTYSEMNLKVNVDNFKYNILMLTDNGMVLHDPNFSTSATGHMAYKVTLKR